MPKSLPLAVVRSTILAASFVASSLTTLAIGALFHHASRDDWLRDTPLARAAVQRCRAHADRQQQRRCLQQLVLAARERDSGARLLLAEGRSGAVQQGR